MGELRLYSFVNFYLSSIQQGIQTGHMTDNMSLEYAVKCGLTKESEIYLDWLKDHKTYIVLNGIEYFTMQEEYISFNELCRELELPYGKFNEPGLGNIMTCYGAVIPEKYFKAVLSESGLSYIYSAPTFHYQYGIDTLEGKLITFIKSKRLAI